MYETLSKAEKDRFRARRSYWKRKGLSEFEAQIRASQSLKNNDNPLITRNTNANKPYNPTPQEIQEEVRRQKALGKFTEVPDASKAFARKDVVASILKSRNQRAKSDSDLEVLNLDSPQTNEKTHARLAYFALQITLQAVAVAAISALLVSASLDVFGTGWDGWLKALLLEFGILYLTVSKTSVWPEWCVKRLCGVAMIGLSFFVLHTGAALTTEKSLSVDVSSNTEIALLNSKVKRLQEKFDALPQSHVTRRAEIHKDLSLAESQVAAKLREARNASSSSVIKDIGLAENMLRACLLVLNLCLAHSLLRHLSSLVLINFLTRQGALSMTKPSF